MRAVRSVLAVLLIIAGVTIVARMAHYPIAQSVTGIILGLAMIALGAVRLRALYGKSRA